MNEKINKNFFKQLLTIFLCILAANYIINISLGAFSQKAYQKYYHSDEKEVEMYNRVTKNYLFKGNNKIDITIYPQTINKLNINQKLTQQYLNEQNLINDKLKQCKKNIKDQYNTENLSIVDFNNDKLYYNSQGKLKYIKIANQDFTHTYNSNGELIEAELLIKQNNYHDSINTKIVFDINQNMKYYFKDYIYTEYGTNKPQIVLTNIKHISFKQYIAKTNIDILLTTFIIWLIIALFIIKRKTNFVFFKSVDKDYFNKQLTPAQKLKSKIWTHIASIAGWNLLVLYTLYVYFIFNNDSLMQLTILMMIFSANIISIGIILIAYSCFDNLKIQWIFLLEHPLYNIIWAIGLILAITLYVIFISVLFFTPIIMLLKVF